MTLNVTRRRWLAIAVRLGAGTALLAGATASHAGSYVDFFRAVNIDNVNEVRRLLERGFDPNTLSEQGQCGLYLALRDKSPRVAELLLNWPGTDLNARNSAGETPLMIAALKGEIGMMTAMLNKGVPIHQTGWTALHYAATGRSVEAVRLLLDRGAPIDARSPNDSTPLMMASRYGAEESVELLVARGADMDLRNQAGMDASDFARHADRDWMVDTLRRLRQRRDAH